MSVEELTDLSQQGRLEMLRGRSFGGAHDVDQPVELSL